MLWPEFKKMVAELEVPDDYEVLVKLESPMEWWENRFTKITFRNDGKFKDVLLVGVRPPKEPG
jgi:hypothetical protein